MGTHRHGCRVPRYGWRIDFDIDVYTSGVTVSDLRPVPVARFGGGVPGDGSDTASGGEGRVDGDLDRE